MRRTVVVATAAILLASAGCRSSVDLSTSKGQLRFGVQAARMDLWREAQFRFLRAVEMNPGDPMAYNNLAVAYEGIGEFEKARESYLRALQIDRSNQYIQRNYSRFVEFYSRRAEENESGETPDAAGAEADTDAGEDVGSGDRAVSSELAEPEPEAEPEQEAEPAPEGEADERPEPDPASEGETDERPDPDPEAGADQLAPPEKTATDEEESL
jgi:tetratricopeptide (TPR) repeat protein